MDVGGAAVMTACNRALPAKRVPVSRPWPLGRSKLPALAISTIQAHGRSSRKSRSPRDATALRPSVCRRWAFRCKIQAPRASPRCRFAKLRPERRICCSCFQTRRSASCNLHCAVSYRAWRRRCRSVLHECSCAPVVDTAKGNVVTRQLAAVVSEET